MIVIEVKKDIAEVTSGKVRRYFDEKTDKWQFSIVDVIGALTNSADERNYWKVLKNRLKIKFPELVTKCNQLKMKSKDGKYYLTDTADMETMVKIIEFIPKATVEAFNLLVKEIQENLPKMSTSLPMEGTLESEAELLIDVFQRKTSVVMRAMVAGVKPSNIFIYVGEKKLIIQGKRERENLNSFSRDYLYEELCWTSFSRTILLPCPVEKDKIKTSIENGILTIEFIKSQISL